MNPGSGPWPASSGCLGRFDLPAGEPAVATLAVLAQWDALALTRGASTAAQCCAWRSPRLSSPLGRRCSPPNTVSEDAVSAAIPQRAPIPTKRAGHCWVSVQSSRAARHKGQPTATG